MNFKIFQLYEESNFNEEALERMVHYLRNLDPLNAGQGLHYLINGDIEQANGIIVGSISEEYYPDSTEVNEDKVLRPVEGIEPYERTIFAFDSHTRNLLVQNRKYSPRNLRPERTFNRLREILVDAFQAVFNSNFNLVLTRPPEGNEVFERIFTNSRVIEVQFSNLDARRECEVEVSNNEIISNGVLELWNNDSSLLNILSLRSKSEGELNSHPFIIAALNSNGVVIDKIKFFDTESDSNVELKRSSMDKYDIPNLDRDIESVTAFQQILVSIPENRGFLRRIRNID